MKRIVVDTNILISASFWRGNPYKIIALGIERKVKIFSSREILEEYAASLRRDFKTPEKEINERINLLLGFVKIVEPKTTVSVVEDDPDDNKIIEAALDANARFIVTGDKHLLKIKKFKGIEIVTPKEFLEMCF